MIPAAFDYAAPGSLPEAVELLRRHGEEAKVIAGGQSLIPAMRFRLARPGVLVDIQRIPGLDFLAEEEGVLRIGPLVRHAEMEASPLIRDRYPLLAETASVVADPLVRNLGTVAGSLVHADPAGDWGAALLAARARVVLTGPGGERELALEDFLVDTFTTAISPDEILTEIRVPAPAPRSGGAYLKIERKVGDFATAAVGVQVAFDADGRCTAAGVGLCAVGPTSLRAREAEAFLAGKRFEPEVLERAGELAAAASSPVADTRGSEAYKRDMVRILTVRALARAAERALAA
ncbi:MAG: xanthine dehydrogenase family protein subunit M [Bacillota bacterium]|nr:xanthine dehydrogenase family protein subunit M [Bacillota bacterium]